MGQGIERQLIETRTGLEGLVGKALTHHALQRLRAINNLLSGLDPLYLLLHVARHCLLAHILQFARVCSDKRSW